MTTTYTISLGSNDRYRGWRGVGRLIADAFAVAALSAMIALPWMLGEALEPVTAVVLP